MTSVLLGVCDGRIPDGATTSWDMNKIGGKPDWMTGGVAVSPCPQCRRTPTLLVQVYCPLGHSPYHRTLYVFGCLSPKCWLQHHCNQVSVGKTVSLVQDSWGEDADDWGDDDMAADDLVAMVTNTASQSVEDSIPMGSPSTGSHVGIPENTDDSVEDIVDNLQEVTLNQSKSEESEECIPEDLNLQPENTALFSLLTRTAESSKVADSASGDGGISQSPEGTVDDSTPVTLNSYYVSVFSEPEKEDVFDHEQQLLAEYQRTEGINISQLVSGSKASGSGGETYEHTLAKHGDHSFHKFKKKIQLCPEQVLRYDYRGSPLHLQPDPKQPSMTCNHCKKPCVFELQLMPTLVTLLHTSIDSDPAVEFGTVHIYTCEDSCWQDGDVYREDHAVVFADPDQKFFKK